MALPAPAATRAAVVETLKVDGPPPVPQVSTRSSRPAVTGVARRRIVRARPTSSGTVSPFARSAIRKAPVWIGSVRPSMTSFRTAEAWSAVRWSPAQTASIARLTMSLGIGRTSRWKVVPGIRGQLRPVADEVGEQVLPLRGEDRLGVKLDALDWQIAMPRAHHHV